MCEYKAADLASIAGQLERLNTSIRPSFWRVDWTWRGLLRSGIPSGNAALEWCRTDQRCVAAVNLDGALWTEVGRIGLDRPAMQVLAEHREFAVTSEDAVKARRRRTSNGLRLRRRSRSAAGAPSSGAPNPATPCR